MTHTHTVRIILKGEKLKDFPLKSRTRQGCPLPLFLFNILLEVPVTTIRHEKETNHIQFGKKEVKVSSYADDIILYMENSENSAQKLLELMNEFIKVAGHKITYRNLLHFFFTVTIKYQKGEVKKSLLKVHQK